ncbi:MAG: tRNA (cytidine(34)-2'-O)-methyltransferase [Gemmatimonadota bacterium]
MPSIALYEPEIPPNAGNVARLCAATASPLHLIGRLGFSFRHPGARRAGMDYWDQVDPHRHLNFDEFQRVVGPARIWGFSTHSARDLWSADFQEGDVLLFGPESRGLPPELLARLEPRTLRIPMVAAARSLNLATAVAIGLYESLRQIGRFPCSP